MREVGSFLTLFLRFYIASVPVVVNLVSVSCVPGCTWGSWTGVEEAIGFVPVHAIDVVAFLALLEVVSAFWGSQDFSKVFSEFVDFYFGLFKPIERVP